MNAFTPLHPTLADVAAVLQHNTKIPRARRKFILSALRSFESWSGKSLTELPAEVPKLVKEFGALVPARLGITPKTLANVKSACLSAVAASELVSGVVRTSARGRPEDPIWAELWNALPTRAQRNNASRLVNWCRRNGISPEAVGDEVVERVMREMAASSLRTDQHRVRRGMTRAWNDIVEIFPEKNLHKVSIPPSRLRRTRIPLDRFPPSLLADWQAFAKWAHGEDVFSDDARPKPLKQSTLDTMLQRIHLAASSLVETGAHPSEVRTLADLVTVDAFKRVGRHRLKVAGGQATYDNFYMALSLLQVARDWVKVDAITFAELTRLNDLLPKVAFGMTPKNETLVKTFDDGDAKDRLLSAPDRIWEHALSSPKNGRLRLAEVQAALGIHILMYMPVRLGNLTELAFDRQLLLRTEGPSTLVLSAEETKTGTAVEYDIPPVLVERLTVYREQIATTVMGSRPTYLFSHTDGSNKGFAVVRYLIQRYLKHYVGVHMNPHVFRHLAAHFILNAKPGAYVVVKNLLGHKKLTTTASFYAERGTDHAGRHHQVLLDQSLAARRAKRRIRSIAGRSDEQGRLK